MRRSALRREILYHTPAQYANISWKEQKADAEENVSFPSAHCRVRLFQSEPSSCARGVISEFSYARGGIRGRLVWRSAPLFRTLYNTTRFVLFRGRRIVYPTEQPPSGKKTAAGLRPNCGQTASFQAFVKAAQRPPAEGHSCGTCSASTPVSLSVPKEFCLNAS